jgi:hypothetical protein
VTSSNLGVHPEPSHGGDLANRFCATTITMDVIAQRDIMAVAYDRPKSPVW